jgi:uncharacterized protein (DUF58 family)
MRVTPPTGAPVGQLELTVLRRLDGLLHGDHRGLLPGHGSEAGEARTYVPGDDPRRIDWAVTARTGEPYVRDTVSDHELELWAVVDASGSMGFGTASATKHEVAWAAVGALVLLASRAGNRVAMVAAGQGRRSLPPRSGRAHVGAVLSALRRAPEPGDRTDLGAVLTSVRRTANRRGMVVVASDFDGDGWERPLRALGAKHDVLAIHVVDPRELALPDVGLVALEDPESGRRRLVDTRDARVRARFDALASAHRDDVARRLAAAGADRFVLRTDRDWVTDLVRFVGSRRARAAAARRPA